MTASGWYQIWSLLSIWTNIFGNLDKYIWQFRQIRLANYDKYIWQIMTRTFSKLWQIQAILTAAAIGYWIWLKQACSAFSYTNLVARRISLRKTTIKRQREIKHVSSLHRLSLKSKFQIVELFIHRSGSKVFTWIKLFIRYKCYSCYLAKCWKIDICVGLDVLDSVKNRFSNFTRSQHEINKQQLAVGKLVLLLIRKHYLRLMVNIKYFVQWAKNHAHGRSFFVQISMCTF